MKQTICALFIAFSVLAVSLFFEPIYTSPLFTNANASLSTPPIAPKTAKTDKTLKDCLAILKNAKGGWCEMRVEGEKAGIANVYAKRTGNIASWGRQSAIINAWCGMGFDEADRIMYFTCGGHADYGGNEVYSFDLAEGRWDRLTEPTPLDQIGYDRGSTSKYIWIPDTRLVPASAHSYDGLIFNQQTKTLFYNSMNAANGAKVETGEDDTSPVFIPPENTQGLFEFNPSSTEVRNGIAPLTWRKAGADSVSYPRTAYLPDGALVVASNSKLYRAKFGRNGEITGFSKIASHADYGDGNMIYDTHRNLLWIVTKRTLRAIAPTTGRVVYKTTTNDIITGKALALDTANNLVMWNGCQQVATYAPETDTWDVVDWGQEGPTECFKRTKSVYSKWHHLGNDVFVGISSATHGVWIYKKGSPSAPTHPERQVVADPL